MSQTDHIDDLLAVEGQKWRAANPVQLRPATPENFPTESGSRSGVHALATTFALGFLAVVAATLIVARPAPMSGVAGSSVASTDPAYVAIPEASESQLPTRSMPAAPTPLTGNATLAPDWGRHVVSDGALARGDGYIAGSDEVGLRFCAATFDAQLTIAPSPSIPCSRVNVPVTGVTRDDLPGWTERREGGGHSSRVSVVGLWVSGRLDVQSITPVEEPDESLPTAPRDCDAPPGGWPGDITEDADGVQALEPLSAFLEQNQDRFLSYWRAPISDDSSSDKVTIVGTTGDRESAYREISRLYRYNLCVRRVNFSGAELRAASRALSKVRTDWKAYVDYPSARVVLEVPTFDENSAAAIDEWMPYVTVVPLLRP